MALYLLFTGYSDEYKAQLVQNPQDRAKVMRGVVERTGGKLHAFYYCLGGEFDAIAIAEWADGVDLFAMHMAIDATGRYKYHKRIPIITAEEGLKAIQKAGQVTKVLA